MQVLTLLKKIVSFQRGFFYEDHEQSYSLYKAVQREDASSDLRALADRAGYSRHLEQYTDQISSDTGYRDFVVYKTDSKIYLVDRAGVKAQIDLDPLSIAFTRSGLPPRILDLRSGQWLPPTEAQLRREREQREREERAERERIRAEEERQERIQRERREREERAERERARNLERERARAEEARREQALSRSKYPKRDRILSRMLLSPEEVGVPSAYRARWQEMVEKYRNQSPPYKLTPMETIIFEEVWNENL